ncbi:MAG TPA: VWA domain-containing protein [Acidobacteriota bacterium]|nr:VWA domain-containing protein [Acidobacteriota bacterium]
MIKPLLISLFSASLITLSLPYLGAQEQQEERQIEEDDSKPQGRAALSVAVQQIRVDVTVRDNKGNLITGLQEGNFEIYEDKVKQEITFFEPIEAPMTAVLVTEYSKVLPWQMLYEAIMASYQFVDGMRQGDWVAVIAYDLRSEILVDFTQDKSLVYNSLRRLNYPAYRESNLYDTVTDTLDRVQELDQRVALIVLSSGLDTFSKINLGDALDRVKRADAVIYTVSLGGNLRARSEHRMGGMQRLDFYQGDSTLKAFAKYTGGESFFPRFMAEFPSIFQTISLLLRNQYSMGYVSSSTKKDGKFRKIKVEVKIDVDGDGKLDKLKVNHREGYLAEKADGS